jgi:pimeloyl-ACP methyl ester carboxylesterase
MRDEWMANGPANVQDVVAGLILGAGCDYEPWFAKWAELPREGFGHAYQCLVTRDDITDRLSDITCPAIVFHGDQDGAITMDRAEELRDGLAGCDQLVVVEGAAHAGNLSHPDQVNAPLSEFLRKHG